MQANYKPKVKPGTAGLFPHMTEKEKRAWLLTEPYRLEEYEAYADATEITLLYALAMEFGFRGVRLRRAWEAMIRYRVMARAMLRQQEGEYQLAATAKNVEDFYFREELRKMGADVQAWTRGMEINFETGEVKFHAPD